MRLLAATALVVVSVALVGTTFGCTTAGRENSGDRSGAPTGEAEGSSASTPPPSDAGNTHAGTDHGREDKGFVASSAAGGGTAGAAERVTSLRFEVLEGYERVILGFGGRGGASSSGVPSWSLEKPSEGGYVRVRLPGVSSTEIAGEDFVGSVVDGLYVVRDPGGGLFVDVFALRPFLYRVTELPGTGQLAVDFRPAEGGFRYPPVRGENAVVVQPREAEEVRSPLAVEGYSRLPGKRTTVSLLDREGAVISSTTVRAGGGTGDGGAWAIYEATLKFPGYEGLATLRVGGANPRGVPRGITYEGAQAEVIVE